MPSKKNPAPQTARKRVDWEAVERDYRTGQFSLRELESKHGAGYAKISKRAKDHGWTKDLGDAVRQATSAALIAEVATDRATKGQHAATGVVLAAAELNKQIILGQRARVAEATSVVLDLLGELRATTKSPADLQAVFEKITEDLDGLELASVQAQFRDFMRLHNRVGSAQKLMDALAKAQAMENGAFALETPAANKDPAKAPGGNRYEMTDEQLLAEIAEIRAARPRTTA